MKSENVLGIDVTIGSYDSIIVDIDRRIKEKMKTTVIAVNPEKIIKSKTDEKLKGLINNSTYKICDGIGVVIASKINGGKIKDRVTGIDMMGKICELAAEKQYPIFLLGAKEEIVTKAIASLESKFPNIIIAGYENGYFEDEKKLIDKINESGAKIIFVALGSPKQEMWIERNIDLLDILLFQGVGGSFDVYSGNIKRAPAIFRRVGLEWFYRLLREPKRIFRQLKIFNFLIYVIKERKKKNEN